MTANFSEAGLSASGGSWSPETTSGPCLADCEMGPAHAAAASHSTQTIVNRVGGNVTSAKTTVLRAADGGNAGGGPARGRPQRHN